MVLSGSKFATYSSSITNQSTAGGSKKAGLPGVIGLSTWGRIALRDRNIPVQLRNYQTFRLKRFPSQNLPVGFNFPIRMH